MELDEFDFSRKYTVVSAYSEYSDNGQVGCWELSASDSNRTYTVTSVEEFNQPQFYELTYTEVEIETGRRWTYNLIRMEFSEFDEKTNLELYIKDLETCLAEAKDKLLNLV